MAYAWIKVHANLKRHPRVIALSDLLADDLAFAYLISLWSWTCEFAPSGRITAPIPARLIERECAWRGEPGRLYRTLVSERWLEELSPTELVVGGWEEYQRPHIEKAEKEAQRLRDYRSKLKQSDQGTGTRTRTGADRTEYRTDISTHDVREKRRGEEIREENKNLALFENQKGAGEEGAQDKNFFPKAPRRGRPPKDQSPEAVAARDAERADGERWMVKARLILGLDETQARWSTATWMAFRRARKARGIDQLLQSLEGLTDDKFSATAGLGWLISDNGITKGLAKYNAGASGVHVSRVQHRVGSSADGYDPFL